MENFIEGSVQRRRTRRGRALIAGRVIFNNASSTLDCVVRNLSEGGAKLEIAGGTDIPFEFSLHIVQKEVTRKARIMWRRGDEVGVEFLRPDCPERSEAGELALLARIRRLEAENEHLWVRVRQLTGG